MPRRMRPCATRGASRGGKRRDEADLSSGYAGQAHCASGTSPYSTDASTYYTVREGFQRGIADTMANDIGVLLNTRVTDIQRLDSGAYRVECRCRDETGFHTEHYECHAVFICVPPSAAGEWSIVRQWGRAQVNAVSAEPLQHVYAQSKRPLHPFHILDSTGPLAQVISPCYTWSTWFQASYSGGRVARFWHRLRMIDPIAFAKRIREELWQRWNIQVDEDVQVHHAERAYHIWKPAPNFCLNSAVAAAVMLHPARLPGVYWVGEAFSSFQGWMEGALETAELAVAIYGGRCSYVLPTRALGSNEVVVDDRIICVDAFKRGHPGGEGALRSHLGEDVSELFRHIGHSDNAWSVVNSLQVAVLANN